MYLIPSPFNNPDIKYVLIWILIGSVNYYDLSIKLITIFSGSLKNIIKFLKKRDKFLWKLIFSWSINLMMTISISLNDLEIDWSILVHSPIKIKGLIRPFSVFKTI